MIEDRLAELNETITHLRTEIQALTKAMLKTNPPAPPDPLVNEVPEPETPVPAAEPTAEEKKEKKTRKKANGAPGPADLKLEAGRALGLGYTVDQLKSKLVEFGAAKIDELDEEGRTRFGDYLKGLKPVGETA